MSIPTISESLATQVPEPTFKNLVKPAVNVHKNGAPVAFTPDIIRKSGHVVFMSGVVENKLISFNIMLDRKEAINIVSELNDPNRYTVSYRRLEVVEGGGYDTQTNIMALAMAATKHHFSDYNPNDIQD